MDRQGNQPIISVRRKHWRKDDDDAVLPDEHKEKRYAILSRDNFTCRFCSFKSSRYQQLHHWDGDYNNYAAENVSTACNLCRQVFHIGKCAMQNSAFIAAIPEITQVEVNNLTRACFVASVSGSEGIKSVKLKLDSLYVIFQQRGADTLKNVFGIDISAPYALAEALSACDDEVYKRRADVLKAIRIVPTREAFSDGQLEFYAVNSSAVFSPLEWSKSWRILQQ